MADQKQLLPELRALGRQVKDIIEIAQLQLCKDTLHREIPRRALQDKDTPRSLIVALLGHWMHSWSRSFSAAAVDAAAIGGVR